MEETWGLQDYSDQSATLSIDPVCGANVDEKHAAAKATYAGETYYFCSKRCHKLFEESPETYVGQAG